MNMSIQIIFVCICLHIISTDGLIPETYSKLSTDLQMILKSPSVHVNILVIFKEKNKWHETHRSLMEESESMVSGRGEKLERTVEMLAKATDESQHSITTMLREIEQNSKPIGSFSSSKVKSIAKKHFQSMHNFFIANAMSVSKVDKETIMKIAADESVQQIKLDETVDIMDPHNDSHTADVRNYSDTTSFSSFKARHFWGIEKIGAADLWAKGYKGKGVVVGSIDTGVMGSHYLLQNRRRTHSWYDPSGTSKYFPKDSRGHGTHTVGTMVGSNGYGVAPEAEWIACRTNAGLSEPRMSYILECMEFMTCPWDAITKKKDCKMAPHVVNNSWGIPRSKTKERITIFDEVISLWRKNGIIPVFASGNSRSIMKCGSLAYPAELPNVIAVGATDKRNSLAEFSSTGPAINGLTKPDISAPGSLIWSASIEGMFKVTVKSGTSMASPHIAGIIALWLSKDKSLTYKQIFRLLTDKANRDIILSESCSSKATTKSFPNNLFGYGLADAKAIFNITPTKQPITKPSPAPSPTKIFRRSNSKRVVYSVVLSTFASVAILMYNY